MEEKNACDAAAPTPECRLPTCPPAQPSPALQVLSVSPSYMYSVFTRTHSLLQKIYAQPTRRASV